MALAPRRLFVGRAVQFNQSPVNGCLIQCVCAEQSFGNFGIHVMYGVADALAEIPSGIPIPELAGFVNSRRSPGGNRGSSNGAVYQIDFHFDGGISSGVQNFPSMDLGNMFHKNPSFSVILY